MRKGGEYALEEGIDKEKSLKKGDTRTVGRQKQIHKNDNRGGRERKLKKVGIVISKVRRILLTKNIRSHHLQSETSL